MTAKRVRTRVTAEAELREAIAYYLSDGADGAALRLIDEFEVALQAVGEYPAIGSAWLEAELGIPGIRSFALRAFPYVIVYVDTPNFVDVRHLLHSARDIPRRISE